MVVLVTGGAGFIGTQLCRELTTAGHEVRVLDLVDPSAERRIPRVAYERGDVLDRKALARAIDGARHVVHFAAIVSVPVCQQRPRDAYETNFLGTVAVLDAIRALRLERRPQLVFSSSAAVYARRGAQGVALDEREASPEPISHYAAQKLASEQAVRVFASAGGDEAVQATVLRFFNVYGVGQDPHSPYSGVISVFADAVKAGRPLRLDGGGGQTRDFVSVRDVARACRLAVERGGGDGGGHGAPLNIGSGEAISIRGLGELLARASGRRVEMIEGPARDGDVLHSRASIERARQVLGWRPEVALETGLRELVGP